MSFQYTILPPPLQKTADAAMKWFIDNWGIKKAAVKVEGAIHPDVELRPTFCVPTGDHHLLCIEVSEKHVYAKHLNAGVLGCVHFGLPVQLFVAVPSGAKDPDYSQNLKAARQAGVGIIEIDDTSGHCSIVHSALPLSLIAVRKVDVISFPSKYRQSLSHALQTFLDGTAPEKACALVYDEIEALFRKIAKRTEDKGFWPNAGNLKIDKAPWATLIRDWDAKLNRTACQCPDLTQALAARILGITQYRNESGHKPKNLKALIKRDQQLRTRFENAVDLFRELVDASKPLKV